MDAHDENKEALHAYVVDSLNTYGLAYLHLVEPEIAGAETITPTDDTVPTAMLSGLFQGAVVVTGEHTLASARRLLQDGVADLVGFGRAFIANPDLPGRLRSGHSLNLPEKAGFYAGGIQGYLTYPSMADEHRWADLQRRIRAGKVDAFALHATMADQDPVELARAGQLYSFTQLQHLVPQPTGSTT